MTLFISKVKAYNTANNNNLSIQQFEEMLKSLDIEIYYTY
jgi:hypothetical protein